MEIEIAELLNFRYDDKTGRVILEMEVTDPVWKQKIIKRWGELDIKLVVEEQETEDV